MTMLYDNSKLLFWMYVVMSDDGKVEVGAEGKVKIPI